MRCPHCGETDQITGQACRRCGTVLPAEKKGPGGLLAGPRVFGLLGVVLLVAVIIAVIGMGTATGTWRDVLSSLPQLGVVASPRPVAATPAPTALAQRPAARPAAEALIPIGRVVATDNWQIVVNDVRIDEGITQLKTGRFAVVDWTIRNAADISASVEIGGEPVLPETLPKGVPSKDLPPERLTLVLRDPAGRQSVGWLYNQVGTGYTLMVAPGDVLRTSFYFPIGSGSLDGVRLEMRVPALPKASTFQFDLSNRAPAGQRGELRYAPLPQPAGPGTRVVVADRWAFTVNRVDVDAGRDGEERVVRVELTAENVQRVDRVLGVTERPGSAQRRDFYLTDQDGHVAYSRGDQMPDIEIGAGEKRNVVLWLYTHDLALRGRYRLSLVLDWQANWYAAFDVIAGGSQVSR